MKTGNVGAHVTGLAMHIAELVETEINLWRVKAMEASNPDLTLNTFQRRLIRQPGKGIRKLNYFNYKLRQITKDAGWSKPDRVSNLLTALDSYILHYLKLFEQVKLGCVLIHLLVTSTTVPSGEAAFEVRKVRR